MALVVADMSISLDGYVTGPNDSRENPFGDGAGMLHDWFGDAATDEDRAILQLFMDGVGAVVMGRTSFKKNEGDGGWSDAGPAGDVPCFVVTRREGHHARSRTRCCGARTPSHGCGRAPNPLREPGWRPRDDARAAHRRTRSPRPC